MYKKWQIPIIQGGMGVGISMGRLAGAVAREGGMGVISTAMIGFREEDADTNPLEAGKRALCNEIEKARKYSQGNGKIAINVMVVTTHYKEMVAEAIRCGIDAIIAGAGLPLDLPELTKGSDVMIAPVVSSGRAAKLIMRSWKRSNRQPDFIVAEGKDAGGHLGFPREGLLDGSSDDLQATVKGVVDEAGDIPVFVGGSVFNADDIKEVMTWGASGVQIATRFIATEECDASQGFKDVILKAKKEDVEIIASPVGLPGRAIETPLIKRVKKDGSVAPRECRNCIRTCNPKTTPYCISRALVHAFNGDYEDGLFFAGANVGRVNEMTTVKLIFDELKQAFDTERIYS